MDQSVVEDILPLSPLQEGLLFHALFDREKHSPYLAQFAVDLDGPVDSALFQELFTVYPRRAVPPARRRCLRAGTTRHGWRNRTGPERHWAAALEVEERLDQDRAPAGPVGALNLLDRAVRRLDG